MAEPPGLGAQQMFPPVTAVQENFCVELPGKKKCSNEVKNDGFAS